MSVSPTPTGVPTGELWTQRVMTSNGQMWVVSDETTNLLTGTRFANPQDVQAQYNSRQYQTAGSGTAWQGGNGRAMPATLNVPTFVKGDDLASLNRTTDNLSRLMRNASRYYIGARFVTVLGCSQLSPTKGRSLTRDITFVLNLKDPYWRLSDDDANPSLFPIESDMGLSLYPLGLFHITDEGAGSYQLEPLTGTVLTANTLTYTVRGQNFAFQTLEAHYDSPYL